MSSSEERDSSSPFVFKMTKIDGKYWVGDAEAMNMIRQEYLRGFRDAIEKAAKVCVEVTTEYNGRGGWTGANECRYRVRAIEPGE